MSLFRILFPLNTRGFRGRRWLNIGLRSLHLVGTAGVGGGFLYQAPAAGWMPYLALTVASGLAMVALELWANGIWLLQLRGQAVVLKLVLMGLIGWWPAFGPHLLVAVVLISGVVSHAPARVRYYSIFHGRRLDSL